MIHTKRNSETNGNVLLCALATILVLSIIGANVLLNSTTRLNVSESQVRGWKDALSAAEAGGDIAFAELRKTVPGAGPSPGPWTGWARSGTTYTYPDPASGSREVTLGTTALKTRTLIEACYFDTAGNFHLGNNPNANNWYRVRSKGTATLPNLKRTGMDDALINDGGRHFAAFNTNANTSDITARGKGDSVLRKIDLNYDHFVTTYEPLQVAVDGHRWDDPPGTRNDPVTVSTPSISRRIEQIVAPVTASLFTSAIKAGGTFYGLGSAAYIDSYRSSVGPYDPTVKDNPSDPRYADSRSGSVQIDSAVASIMGEIYGNLYTNGGTVTKKTTNLTGTVDNNVPFSMPPLEMPDHTNWNSVSTPTSVTSSTPAITPPAAGTLSAPNYYLFSSFADDGNLTINPHVSYVNGVAQPPDETYVAVHVTGNIGSSTSSSPTITVPAHVHLKVYFDGNFQTKAQNIINTSGYAANLQFYGISPTDPNIQQTIDINSGGGSNAGFAATFYAPSATMTINGGPDITGSIVANNFHATGNVTWHFDLDLNNIEGDPIDYRIVSYVEDTR